MEQKTLDELHDFKRFASPEWIGKLQEMSCADVQTVVRAKSHVPSIQRVQNLRKWLDQSFVGKTQLIDLMLCCTVAQLPMLMLGTWGTGKSLLVRKLAEGMGIAPTRLRIDDEDKVLHDLSDAKESGGGAKEPASVGGGGRHFEYLVTRFTTPEEILGAANVDLMLRKSIHMRQTQGLLPRAEIAFLDEVFKANSSILNALLAILNERVLHNAGRVWRVNLIMLFGASNEIPSEEDGDELGAFYDRFPVRAVCDPVGDHELSALLGKSHAHHFAGEFPGGSNPPPVDMPCVNDFRLLHRVSLVKFGGPQLTDDSKSAADFLDRFQTLFRHLRVPHDLSDRSFGQYYRLARSRALLEGREHLTPEDCQVLYHCGKDPRAASELRAWVDRALLH